ncbi:hypothetical protein ACFQ4A_00260 [Lentibacillus salinarum]|uniref:Uncharacterized protein n=2 Tax=Lentibacillus salinarum TaxID=446820 RepID=A0ABW3ZQF1_9BACI
MEGNVDMSVEANKVLVRRFFETIEQEKYQDLKVFCHPDFVFYPQLRSQIFSYDTFTYF